MTDQITTGAPDCEYVVVGSGAGGGTVAARLAEAGRKVMLLEAGGDPRELTGGVRGAPAENRLPDDYDVPAFHPFASENEAIRWDFFVRHFDSDERQRRNPRHYAEWDGKAVDGILYPRAAALGGCTAHNAMIFIRPHDADWDSIAELTGDSSWSAANMQRYFQRLENCQYRKFKGRLATLGVDPTGHGWNGWLSTERALPWSAMGDERLMQAIIYSARAASKESGHPLERLSRLLRGALDPNDLDLVRTNADGVRYTPLTTSGHRRVGARERVLDVAKRFPDRLRVELNALATKILFDGRNRAIGVEYLKGERLYRAHGRPSDLPAVRREALASREVILAGGSFTTPQLLMLSGIGPPQMLKANGIAVRFALPGVGQNLQDRYEISVVNRMRFNRWEALKSARFTKGDHLHRKWQAGRDSLYASNGTGLAVVTRSTPDREAPDLFCMALLGRFEGYYPGYAAAIGENLNYLSWTVLKAHTENRAGVVALRSNDPRDPPKVNFRYFEDGSDQASIDLAAVVAGIRFVRRITQRLKDDHLVEEEELPSEELQSDEQLKDFVRENAWGHHASCSCHIGPKDKGGVLSSDLRVHGVMGLRVADASVFPRIPGFFLASAVYMVGEKAADIILADAAGRAAS